MFKIPRVGSACGGAGGGKASDRHLLPPINYIFFPGMKLEDPIIYHTRFSLVWG